MITRAITVNSRVSNTSNVLNNRKDCISNNTFGMLLSQHDKKLLVDDVDGAGDALLRKFTEFYNKDGHGAINKKTLLDLGKEHPGLNQCSRLAKAIRIASKWVILN